MTNRQLALRSSNRGGAISLNPDKIFFWVLFVFIALSSHIRELGGLLLFVFLAAELFYIAVTRSWALYLSPAAFTVLGLLYVLFSYVDVLPHAWARFYVPLTIPQQASFVAILYPSILAGRRLWTFFLADKPSMPWRIFALSFSGAVLSQIAAPSFIVADWHNFYLPPGNAGFFLYLGVFYFLLFPSNVTTFCVSLGIVLGGIVLAPELQTKLLLLLAVALVITPWPRLVVAGWCATLVAMYLYAFFNPVQIWNIDVNSGIRAFFARDAVEALWQTGGLGVGFGKEAIKNIYPIIGHTHTNWETKFDGFVMISVHNSFTAIFYRLGLLGGLLFAWIVIFMAFPSKMKNLNEEKYYSFLFAVLFIALFVNVGLESPTYSPIVTFGLGILICVREGISLPSRVGQLR